MNAIEIIALVFSLGVLLKMVFVLFSKKSWMGFVKKIYSKPMILFLIELIVAVIVFGYLLQSLSIVEIMACIVLGALLTGMSFTFFMKELYPSFEKMLKSKVLKKAWLLMLLWLALAIWVLITLF